MYDLELGFVSSLCGLRCVFGSRWCRIFIMYMKLKSWLGLHVLSEDEVEALLVRVWGLNKGSFVEVW